MMPKSVEMQRIHHINFLVKDLDLAIQKYRQWFGVDISDPQNLPERGVITARFKVGEVWIVLVQPVKEESVPAQYLREHGEGVFLVSCQVEDVGTASRQIIENGGKVSNTVPRQGLEDWQLIDLPPDELFGVNLQLVQTKEKP